MTSVTKMIVLATAAVAAFVLVYPAARERLSTAMHFVRDAKPAGQSASQLSSEEFAQVGREFTPERLRSFAGEPASRTNASVEGVRLECWYYGVAGARGAYQICFQNGRLTAKAHFG